MVFSSLSACSITGKVKVFSEIAAGNYNETGREKSKHKKKTHIKSQLWAVQEAWGQGQLSTSLFLLFIYFRFNFIYFWLCWVFVATCRLSLVAASRGYSSLWCMGFSLRWLLLFPSVGSRRMGCSSWGTRAQQLWHVGSRAQAQFVAHGLSCSMTCGIFPDQGLNLCPLHWQVDSYPLCHWGSPQVCF